VTPPDPPLQGQKKRERIGEKGRGGKGERGSITHYFGLKSVDPVACGVFGA